jgi:rubredoxin
MRSDIGARIRGGSIVSDETENKEESKESSKGEGDRDGRVTDAETSFEEYTGEKKCPECDEPINNVRANCPNCGYEYKDSDYDDEEAGSEFVAGSAVDDEGNEVPDDETGGGEESDDGGKEDADDKGGSGDE